MKILIEIDEETAACLWDDVTWGGKYPRTVPEILVDLAQGQAVHYRRANSRDAVLHAVSAYRTANPQTDARE